MERLINWVKGNVAPAYLIMLGIFFFAAHAWYPIIYLFYAAFAFGFGYFVFKYVKGKLTKK